MHIGKREEYRVHQFLFYLEIWDPRCHWKNQLDRFIQKYTGNSAFIFFFLILNDIFVDRNFPHLLYVGYYKIRQPAIIIRDPELARTILIKEFNSFHDNDIELDEKFDPIGGKNPFVAKGNRWKISKSQLTPCFTSKKVKSLLYYFL